MRLRVTGESDAVVGHSFSGYERELRYLLEGQPAAVRSYARSLPPTERAEFERVIDEPFLVIRGAGSLGLDLVALRRELAFPIEVKASGESVIRFTSASGRANAQLEAHRRAVGRAGLAVVYAYRRLGLRREEAWRVYVANAGPSSGVLGLVFRRMPAVGATREGNGILRWDDGVPLSKFLARTRFLLERPGGVSG